MWLLEGSSAVCLSLLYVFAVLPPTLASFRFELRFDLYGSTPLCLPTLGKTCGSQIHHCQVPQMRLILVGIRELR